MAVLRVTGSIPGRNNVVSGVSLYVCKRTHKLITFNEVRYVML